MEEQTASVRSAVRRWCHCRTYGLQHCLEIFQLDQPDAGYDRSVGCFHVPVQGEEELLDHRSSGYLYERRIHDLFLLRVRVFKPWYRSGLSGWYRSGCGIPWNLHPCNQKAADRVEIYF